MNRRERWENRFDNVMAVVCLLALIFILFAPPAIAGGYDNDDPKHEQNQWQDQVQDQSQDQSQGQEQHQTMGGQENVQTMTFTSPDDIKVRRTNMAYAPSIDPSHSCALTKTGGLSLPGGSISGGKAEVDPECNARETARLFYE